MDKEVEFLFDYGSPFSYLASLQVEGFAKRNDAAVRYTPILLGAVLKATGNASPMMRNSSGLYAPAPNVSSASTAYPSIAARSNPGTETSE